MRLWSGTELSKWQDDVLHSMTGMPTDLPDERSGSLNDSAIGAVLSTEN